MLIILLFFLLSFLNNVLDVRPRAENTPINIHISPFIDRLCEIILTLVSINSNERRMYVIDFLRM